MSNVKPDRPEEALGYSRTAQPMECLARYSIELHQKLARHSYRSYLAEFASRAKALIEVAQITVHTHYYP